MMRKLLQFRPLTGLLQAHGARFLFTADALNLNSFVEGKERAILQFHTPQMQDKFKERMEDSVKSDSSNMIFSEDVKNMLFLAEGNDRDVNLLTGMLERYNMQNSGAKFAPFSFGPVIMRFLYINNQPLEAVKMLKNPNLIELFDQFMSYQLVMDMLVKNKLFDEAYEVFEILQSRAIRGDRFPKNSFVLLTCALYLQNTPESYGKMIRLLEDMKETGSYPTRRAITFAAALAINQGHSDIGLNIISAASQANYISVRNIKALAYFKVGRIQDALTVLRTSVDYESPSGGQKRNILSDVFFAIEEGIRASGDKELQLEFDRIHKACVAKNLVDSMVLHDMLMAPIDKRVENPTDMWNNKRSSDYGGVNRNYARNDFQNRGRDDRPRNDFQNRERDERPRNNFQNRERDERPRNDFQNRERDNRPRQFKPRRPSLADIE